MTEEQTRRRQDAKTPRLDRRAFMTLGRAERHAPELLHFERAADARESRRLAAARGRAGAAAPRALAERVDDDAAGDVHGDAPLCRGVVRDRDLARRAGGGDRGALPTPRRRALHPVRLVRLRLLEWLGHGERAAPAD